jgi:stage II sporulation protein AA (anti-sigma F factor antagonist)
MLDPDAPAFDVRVVDADDRPVIVARGEIDLAAYDVLRRCIESCCVNREHVVLDVAEVTFMDSTGINALMWAHQRLGERPGAVVLRNPGPPVVRVLEVAGLTGAIAIETTPDASLDGG